MSADELAQEIEDLSRDAFALARAAALGEGDAAERKERAQEIDGNLDALVQRIQEAPEDQQPRLIEPWNDARADVLYVLSDGAMPTSLRMGAFLRDQQQSE